VPHVLLKKRGPRGWHKGEEPLTFSNEGDVSLAIKLQPNHSSEEVDALVTEVAGDARIRVIGKR